MSKSGNRLRVWPGVLMLIVGMATTVGFPLLAPRTMLHFFGMMGGPILASVGVVIWWLSFSRLNLLGKVVPVTLFILGAVVMAMTLHHVEPFWVGMLGVPMVAALWVVGAVVTRLIAAEARCLEATLAIIVGWVLFGLVRIDGADANVRPNIAWRFDKTDEERFNEELSQRSTAEVAIETPIVVTANDWAEFRGPNRDDVVTTTTIRTDWEKNPPKEIWRKRIGPGWGSFAVVGDYLFTMEQRGDDEAVVCYRADTFAQAWEHREQARFNESIAGPGPRSTPTIVNGMVYAQGASGILVKLDVQTGKLQWKRNIADDTGAITPQWGFASSPLIVDDKVIAFAGAGSENKAVIAYDAETGQPAWTAGAGTHSYASGQLVQIAEVPQVLFTSNYGIESFNPVDGTKLWEFVHGNEDLNRVTQPILLKDGDVLFGTGVGDDQGLHRLHVTRDTDGSWVAKQVWFTNAAQPYFNDGVVHEGYYYGYKGASIVAVDLKTGKQTANLGTKYGFGQLLVLKQQSLLLVQNANGSIALVECDAGDPIEIANFPALKGKTWNHPVIANGRLYLRNGREAACYDVSED